MSAVSSHSCCRVPLNLGARFEFLGDAECIAYEGANQPAEDSLACADRCHVLRGKRLEGCVQRIKVNDFLFENRASILVARPNAKAILQPLHGDAGAVIANDLKPN